MRSVIPRSDYGAAIVRAAAESQRSIVGWMVDRLRELFARQVTLLAVCPNSAAVLEAAVAVSAQAQTPILLAATLNQVDEDGGYTGWTQESFVSEVDRLSASAGGEAFLLPCLDHGGPWQKDAHATQDLPTEAAMQAVMTSIEACLDAGYHLLHIDATVDPRVALPLPVEVVVERTVDLMLHAERYRRERMLPPVAYEVGTEEVHAELVDQTRFKSYLSQLKKALDAAGLENAWPSFVVARVGTELHTRSFGRESASQLTQIVSRYGSLLKGHYTDFAEEPEAYPRAGMGGANVGPELTHVEYRALEVLAQLERESRKNSGLLDALEDSVERSGRWTKWLREEEKGTKLRELPEERRSWLISTGCRYIWMEPEIRDRRATLYRNVARYRDAHGYVVSRISATLMRYLDAFNLRGLGRRLLEPEPQSPSGRAYD